VNSLKFHPGRLVFKNSTREFLNPAAAASSPLAAAIFRIPGVTNVFFGADFVSVTKLDEIPWEEVKPSISQAISEFFASGAPIIADGDETVDECNDTSEVETNTNECTITHS
jgi:hypothetical protein